ncbi:MAG: hypothetical protein KW788_00085 [Candidatus Doudnabacteria bacterium]|nr:hypothetical protein [Candidatus Doudnabacteria bacterium]
MTLPAIGWGHVEKTVFELDALEGLQCGCVAAAYTTQPWGVPVVLLEAKGPYCILAGHTNGEILRIGDADNDSEQEDDDEDEA